MSKAAAAAAAGSADVLSFKVVIVGRAAAGKSCLIQRFVKNSYDGMTPATPGAEFSTRVFRPDELETGGQQLDREAARVFGTLPVRIVVVDMPGQDSLASITPMALRNADAAFICFDICEADSFAEADKWLRKVLRQSPQAMPVLVACKADLDDVRVVSRSDADALAKKNGMLYFETSSKNDSNVLPTFRFVATNLRQRWFANASRAAPKEEQKRVANPNAGGVDLNTTSRPTEGKKCCG
jgi:Ras-related protein Rab-5C